MNTQNIKELEESQNMVISQWKASLLTGIKDGYINTEDSTPNTTIMGNFDKQSGLQFAQDLANKMDIRILVNRIETWYKSDESVLHLIYDVDPKQTNKLSVQSNPNKDNRLGLEVNPQPVKKLKM